MYVHLRMICRTGNDYFHYRFQELCRLLVQSAKGLRCCYSSPLVLKHDLNSSFSAGLPPGTLLIRKSYAV